MLKILLLNQFFWPDNAATGQLLTDLARALAAEGHEVTAICSEKGGYADAGHADAPRVDIIRVNALPFVRGKIGRVLSYLSFYLLAAWRGLMLPKQDVVLTLTTPPLLSVLGTFLKTIRGSRHFIWEMDVYPDVAIDLHYFQSGGVADRSVGLLADFSRRHADGIIALGECMKERLCRRGISPDKIFVAHNWADSEAIKPVPRAGDPERLVLLYSGNLGLAHDLGTIKGSIEALRSDRRFKFLFVGSGGRRQELVNFVRSRGVQSVELRPYVQRQSLSESLAAGDIGLVTQQESCCGSVVPSKVYGLLAAGLPILFIGPRGATPARIVATFGCGWHVNVGDVEGLTTLLRRLADHRTEIAVAGQRARQTLLDHFDLRHGVARVISVLEARTMAQNSSPRLTPESGWRSY